ncbi:MAG: alpha/beta fold hydrolase [Myxococcaceae bacterium]|jgi:triacylglycerol lipase|nr:alpha/beta fold hydrolase [Myxococcaceae bacterium]MCA3014219.1 alpha/beta fold hydrolase [Myxococcaceae bacterium]
MLGLKTRARQLKRQAQYLKGYFDLDATNTVVRRTDFTNCPRPVLLLYGFMSTRRVFEVLEHRLRRDQFCVWSIDLGGWKDAFNTNAIDVTAEKVRDKIERLYGRYPSMGPLSIIGHSKGGIIGSYYVKRLGGDRRVRNLITMGSPHNGSPSAYFGIVTHGLISRSIWQLTPMSPFITRLKMGAFPKDVRLVNLFSKADRVNPFPSCLMENPFEAPNVSNIEIADVKHREFVISRTVYQVLRRELFTGYGLPVPAEPKPRRLVPLR